MCLIVVMAFLATAGFYRRAKHNGIHPGKAASIPFVGAGLMLAFTYIAIFVIGGFLVNADISDVAIFWISQAIDWFVILSYAYYIKRNWDLLSASQTVRNESPQTPDSQAN